MKNLSSKLYMTLLLIFSNLIIFAQPGNNDGFGGLEGGDAPAAPVDDWIIPFIVLSSIVGYYLIRKKFKNSTIIQ